MNAGTVPTASTSRQEHVSRGARSKPSRPTRPRALTSREQDGSGPLRRKGGSNSLEFPGANQRHRSDIHTGETAPASARIRVGNRVWRRAGERGNIDKYARGIGRVHQNIEPRPRLDTGCGNLRNARIGGRFVWWPLLWVHAHGQRRTQVTDIWEPGTLAAREVRHRGHRRDGVGGCRFAACGQQDNRQRPPMSS